jgi:APA family basic amino acid/polyamine antiporter
MGLFSLVVYGVGDMVGAGIYGTVGDAVSNTVLINYIMGSRLLYGMARQGLMPAALGRVHPRRRTPHVAILTLLAVVVVLAMSGGADAVRRLADATALLLLSSFIVVNMSLIVLKRRPGEPAGGFEVPAEPSPSPARSSQG